MANVMGFPSPPPQQNDDFMQKLLAGLVGQPQGYGGALTPEDQRAQQQQAMLALGSQLLAGSGPSPVKQSFGSILGPSLMAAQQAGARTGEQQLQALLMQSQIQKNKQLQQQNKNHVIGNALVDDTGKVVYQGSALDNTFGRVNPGDYDPASLAEFQRTGDWNVLKRVWAPVNPTVQTIGQVPTVVQPSRTGAPPTTFPLSSLPNELSTTSQMKGAESRGSASGKITGEREGKAPTAYAAYKAGVASLEKSMSETATGPIAGRIPAVTAAQQTAEGAEATMAPILKDLFRSSGEGTFTEGDQALLLKMVPTRTDHEEARKAKLVMIDEIVRAKLGIAADGAVPGAQPSGNIDALLDKYAPKK
jgi:hypothetical protein